MRTVVALTLVVAALAGCVEGDEPVSAATAELAAPTPSPAAAEGATSGTAEAPRAPVLVDVPVSYEGRTSSYGCAPSGPGSCTGIPLNERGENEWYPIAHEGLATSLDLTVTWLSTAPTTEEMGVIIVATMTTCDDADEGCGSRAIGEETRGTSPLAIRIPDLGLAQGESIAVHIGNAQVSETPAGFLFVGVRQEFSVEGTLVAAIMPDE